MDIKGKIAVVTGAGSGIGQALAIQLAQKGATVAITDYNADTLLETYARIKALLPDATVSQHVFDVSNKEAFHDFANTIIQTYGHLDIMVNNAGVALTQMTIEETPYEDWEWIFGINLWGMIYGTKAFLKVLKARPEACLVNVSSIFGMAGIGLQAPYCVTKFGIRGFTESLRMELLMEDSKLNVISVHPGGIKTNIVRNARTNNEAFKKKLAKTFETKLAKTTPLDAAKAIIKGIEKNKQRVMIGSDARWMDRIIRLFPVSYSRIFGKRIRVPNPKK